MVASVAGAGAPQAHNNSTKANKIGKKRLIFSIFLSLFQKTQKKGENTIDPAFAENERFSPSNGEVYHRLEQNARGKMGIIEKKSAYMNCRIFSSEKQRDRRGWEY